jgi:NMD protein affecting ribosome stability and mRNA decay
MANPNLNKGKRKYTIYLSLSVPSFKKGLIVKVKQPHTLHSRSPPCQTLEKTTCPITLIA